MIGYNGIVNLRNDGVDPSTTKKDLNAAIGASITVRFASVPIGQGVKADLFDINGAAIANPATSDNFGNYFFKIASGAYDIIFQEGTANEVIEPAQAIGATAELINDLSQAYEFDELNDAVIFDKLVVGKVASIKERITGNGGGAIWDAVLASTVTPDTFGIVQCTGVPTLALVLRVQNPADVSHFGAIGDGVVDDTNAIRATLTAASNVIFPKKKTFKLTGELIVVNAGIDLNKSELVFVTFNAQRSVWLQNNSYIKNGIITSQHTHTLPNLTGQFGGCITAGIYPGVFEMSNIIVENMTLNPSQEVGTSAGVMHIMGFTHNVIVRNVEITDSPTIPIGIALHWTADSLDPNFQTELWSPHEVSFDNINIGKIPNATAFFTSSPYQVSFNNINCEECKIAYFIFVGDFGYRGHDQMELENAGQRGLSIKNNIFLKVLETAISRRVYDEVVGELVWPASLLVENSFFKGNGASSPVDTSGITLSDKLTVRNTVFDGFYYGTFAYRKASDVLFENVEFYNTISYAINTGVDFGEHSYNRVIFRQCIIKNCALSVSVGDPVCQLRFCTDWTFDSNYMDSDQQLRIIYFDENRVCNRNKVINNTFMVKTGNNIAFTAGVFASQNIIAIASGNEFDGDSSATARMYTGQDIVPYAISPTAGRVQNRVCYGSATPTTGTWRAGDIIWNAIITPTGRMGWMCVTSGTSGGTWHRMPNVVV